jgi:hypothetical protein
VEAAIEKLKNKKATGMDFIQAELVKHAGTEYTKYLHQKNGTGVLYALYIRKEML